MLHIVVKEKETRDLIASLANSRTIAATPYESGDAFFAAMRGQDTLDPSGECILLDARIPDKIRTALHELFVFRDLRQRLPVIFMADHVDFKLAVEVLKRGAFDFFEMPFNDDKLMDRVEEALSASRQARLIRLTAREKEVLHLILAGHMNKAIGERLGISTRTVEVHRAHIFDKAQVKNAIELVRLFMHG